MINTLLLEDNKTDREFYISKLQNNLKGEIHILNPEYSHTYADIEAVVEEHINNTDLIIADVALTENIDDVDTWASKLLLDVLDKLGKNAPIKRRGIAIVFMTAHVQEEVQTRARLHHSLLFRETYILTEFIRKGYLIEDLKLYFEIFREEFILNRFDKRWYNRKKLQEITHNLLKKDYLFENNITADFKIKGEEIIMIEYDDKANDAATLFYRNAKKEIEKTKIYLESKKLVELLQVYEISESRKIDYNFLQKSICFLHTKISPFALINPHLEFGITRQELTEPWEEIYLFE